MAGHPRQLRPGGVGHLSLALASVARGAYLLATAMGEQRRYRRVVVE